MKKSKIERELMKISSHYKDHLITLNHYEQAVIETKEAIKQEQARIDLFNIHIKNTHTLTDEIGHE
jgi:hypothetical protein